MKRKLLLTTLSVALLASVAASCTPTVNDERQRTAIEEAQGMTYEELLAKAKEEVGDGEVNVFGNSSALDAALVNFQAETGIRIKNNKLGDVALYDKLFYTIGNGSYSADMVLLQDGNSLQTKMINPGYLLNYVPKDYVDVLDEEDKDPLAGVYLNKVFMYNNTDGTDQGAITDYLTNVWQLAGTSADANHISGLSFKDARQELVNMNFLIMLTSDEWVEKLTVAYKSYYGVDYVAEPGYINIGYKWIEEFLNASGRHSSDGTATKDAAKGASKSMVYANYNKLKDCKQEGVGREDPLNLTTAIMENEDLEGFGGFVYKMYTQIARNAKYPFAACALANYILSTEGFGQAWGGLSGYYSPNPANEIAEGDKPLSWWKSNCVIEDPKYVSSNYFDISEFIITKS